MPLSMTGHGFPLGRVRRSHVRMLSGAMLSAASGKAIILAANLPLA